MANLQTLQPQPFPKGVSGNPNGRPKGSRNRATILREILAVERKSKNELTGKAETMEVEKEMEIAIVQKALQGDVKAYNAVKDNTYGKLPEKMEIESSDIQQRFVRICARIEEEAILQQRDEKELAELYINDERAKKLPPELIALIAETYL